MAAVVTHFDDDEIPAGICGVNALVCEHLSLSSGLPRAAEGHPSLSALFDMSLLLPLSSVRFYPSTYRHIKDGAPGTVPINNIGTLCIFTAKGKPESRFVLKVELFPSPSDDSSPGVR